MQILALKIFTSRSTSTMLRRKDPHRNSTMPMVNNFEFIIITMERSSVY